LKIISRACCALVQPARCIWRVRFEKASPSFELKMNDLHWSQLLFWLLVFQSH
jgi:hypothetical protein